MNQPPPFALALSLAPTLKDLDWAIGGSTLLYRLGIEEIPCDLDIVTTSEHFSAVDERLSLVVGVGYRPGHPSYRSANFERFTSPLGVTLDAMAAINVLVDGQNIPWTSFYSV